MGEENNKVTQRGHQKPTWSQDLLIFQNNISLFVAQQGCQSLQDYTEDMYNIKKQEKLMQFFTLNIHTLVNQGCEMLQLIRRQRRGVQAHLNDKRCSGGDLRERHCPDNGDSATLTVCESDEASNMENSSHGLLLSPPIFDLYPYPFSFFKSSLQV